MTDDEREEDFVRFSRQLEREFSFLVPQLDLHALAMALQLADLVAMEIWPNLLPTTQWDDEFACTTVAKWLRIEVQRELWSAE